MDGDQELPAGAQSGLFSDECAEDNHHVTIGKDDYFISADGLLMPAKKDQPPPDLRYFKETRK